MYVNVSTFDICGISHILNKLMYSMILSFTVKLDFFFERIQVLRSTQHWEFV